MNQDSDDDENGVYTRVEAGYSFLYKLSSVLLKRLVAIPGTICNRMS